MLPLHLIYSCNILLHFTLSFYLANLIANKIPNASGSSSSSSDMMFIRHGRSRVRHSNEKDHIRWGLQAFDNLTLDYDFIGYDNDTGAGGSGNGQLFGSEFWLNSDNNESYTNQTTIFAALESPLPVMNNVRTGQVSTTTSSTLYNAVAVSSQAPLRKKKLHKKKIMENIRKNVNIGLEYLKQHRNLIDDQMQPSSPEQHVFLDQDFLRDQEQSVLAQDTYNQPAFPHVHNKTEKILQQVVVPKLLNMTETKETKPKIYNSLWQNHNLDVTLSSNNLEPTSDSATLSTSSDGMKNSTTVESITEIIKQPQQQDHQHPLSQHWSQQQNKTQNHQVKQKKELSLEAKTKNPTASAAGTGSNSDEYKHQQATADSKVDYQPNVNEDVGVDSADENFGRLNDKHDYDDQSPGPNQSASTSVSGTGLNQAENTNLEEINLDVNFLDINADNPDVGGDGFSADNEGGFVVAISDMDMDETNKFLEGVVDGANPDEIYDWDEISRNNRRNLMRGRDVVTKFLQIVETQHSLGADCEAGTSLNLGEGVVDRYAQDRFRIEAEVAVNRANMLTRIFKMTSPSVQASVNLLHASVLSMVEFDDDIFAAGNCFDWNQHPSQTGLFCPFAYRLPAPNQGAIIAKDLATEYHYLGNTSEWFFLARKNAEKVIARNDQYIKAFHLYSNKTEERIEEDTLAVRYEDGRWSKPYYDCGGGNIWMLTYTVPFFGYENGTYFFKGTSGIDIDLRRVDIDQCPQRNSPGTTQPLNIFAGTDKCKQRTTMCEALKGLGFRRGSYKCVCRKGFYFPDTLSTQKYFNGSLLEEEYEKLMLGKNSTYNIVPEYECLACAEGCDSCEDSSPCIAALNWPMRMSILVLACAVIGLLPPAAWFTFRYRQVKVIRAASPALLRVIALGAFFIYCTTIVMYPNPNLYTCTARIWLREIGFSLTYGALMLKTWRISVIFRVRSAKAVKITDGALLKRLGIMCGIIGTCLLVRTLVSPPDVVVGRTADDLKAFLCKTDWWDYTFTSMEVLFLAWGVRLCIMVRKAPSEFNESRFISMAIYNEFLLTCFLNVSMLFLQSPANPDLLYIIFFCHTQLTVTLLLGLIFGSKVYIVLRSGKSHQEAIGMGAKSTGAKFNFRPQIRTFANPSSATTSSAPIGGTVSAETKLSDQEALEEIRQLSVQLKRIQEMAPPKGVAVMTISSLLDGIKTTTGNQLMAKQSPQLQLLSLSNDIHKYNPSNPNVCSFSAPLAIDVPNPVAVAEKSINTSMTGNEFIQELLDSRPNFICNRCLWRHQELKQQQQCGVTMTTLSCQQLGSPQPEGSISFSNIELDCMCSQSDDLDRIPQQHHASSSYRAAAFTKMPSPPDSTSRIKSRSRRSSAISSKNKGNSNLLMVGQTTTSARGSQKRGPESKMSPFCDNHKSYEHFLICDNCKNKLSSVSPSRKNNKNKLATTSATTATPSSLDISTARSNELSKEMERSCDGCSGGGGPFGGSNSSVSASTIEGCPGASVRGSGSLHSGNIAGLTLLISKKIHSIDDITFYTTTDEDSDTSAPQQGKSTQTKASLRHHSVVCHSTSALSSACNQKTITDAATTSTSSSSFPVGIVTDSARNCVQPKPDGSASSNSSAASETTINNKRNERPRRPDKLVLDLNDHSKYTKEVSV